MRHSAPTDCPLNTHKHAGKALGHTHTGHTYTLGTHTYSHTGHTYTHQAHRHTHTPRHPGQCHMTPETPANIQIPLLCLSKPSAHTNRHPQSHIQAYPSNTLSRSPTHVAQSPQSVKHTPITHVYTLITHVYLPITHVYTPITHVYTPITHAYTPITHVYTPITHVYTHTPITHVCTQWSPPFPHQSAHLDGSWLHT